MSERRAHRVITFFETTIRALVSKQVAEGEEKTLNEMETISDQDLRDVWDWNEEVPKTSNTTVDSLFADMALKHPDSPAVCAWDGEWTYKELDEASNRLSHHLVGLGVGPEVIVPLCFEKSRWMPVAMLAVMKAGGASAAMDTTQPEERLRAIVQQINPVLVLSSSANQELARRLTDPSATEIVVVDETHLANLNRCDRRLKTPAVQPWDKLYIAFTSGSTGTPKGAVITHSSFSSALLHQQTAHGFEATARVYDFSSYAFDIAWFNVLFTLTCGACLCIPSESERRDDLSNSIRRYRATIATLTPSTASILPLETIQSLQTLLLAGESLRPEDAQRWASMTSVRNSYGPCECTPISTMASITPKSAGGIGSGIGVNTWVVRPSDHDYLAIVGSVGELLLEGPLIGSGYLGDVDKTAAAFIEDPPWLLRGSVGWPGRRGRLYKTGDLVRHNPDGSLSFIGRKDSQVKIQGQRVELGDIESHLAQHPSTRQSAVLLPESGPCAKRLVGVLSFKRACHGDDNRSIIQLVPNEDYAEAQEHIEALKTLLEETIPSYMIPSIWITVRDIPLSSSGKMDKRQLQTWICGMDVDTFAEISHADRISAPREPMTDAERLLRDACSIVLGMPAATINLQRSFVANGGDSISAMRLSSHCRTLSLVFSVASLLKSKSLASVAQLSATTLGSTVQQREVFNKPFTLSPIQQWFFAQSSEEVNTTAHYFNQGFYVKIRRYISPEDMSSVVLEVVKRHSMFRSRFQRVAGNWTQQVLEPTYGLHHFKSSQVESLNEIAAQASQRHQQLDIEKGPVFTADMFSMPSGDQYLVLIAHHLVVDLVSWRIVLGDLQTLLTGGKIETGLPFQVWNELQTERAKSSQLDPSNVLSAEGTENNLEFWDFDQKTPCTSTDYIGHSLKIGQQVTLQVLKDANRAFNTEPVDLILSAVWDAFLRVFSDRREGLTIFSEGHGREPWSEEIDLTRTVGWFTTISPIHISRTAGNSLANIVRLVKDMRRQLPSNGWAYFASRYLNDKGIKAFKSHDSMMEVVFNYHGQFQQLEQQDSLFSSLRLNGVSSVGLARSSPALVNINASIVDGSIQISFSWNRHIAHQSDIRNWVEQVAPSLQVICQDLTSRKPSTTLCDYEFLHLDYQRLEELQSYTVPLIESANDAVVDDIYPCSSMVDGMLLSQVHEPESYKTSHVYEITSQDMAKISLEDLASAWQSVIARHASLRSVFIEGLDTTAAFNQVVLKSCHGDVILMRDECEVSALAALKQLSPVKYRQLTPPHRLALCQISDGNRIFCRLEMSHAITDGASVAITVEDWAAAYARKLSVTDLSHTSREFARTLKTTSTAEKMVFWKDKLAGIAPCRFPNLSDSPTRKAVEVSRATVSIGDETFAQVQRFCEEFSVTPASVLQSAWALTLAAYTGTDSVCFGYLASGRDVAIQGIEHSIGAYANMLICRADISRQWTTQQFVRHIHSQVIGDLAFQHCSLAAIQHELNVPLGQGLYNTIFSFQARDDDRIGRSLGAGQGLRFRHTEGENITEVGSL